MHLTASRKALVYLLISNDTLMLLQILLPEKQNKKQKQTAVLDRPAGPPDRSAAVGEHCETIMG